MTVSTGVSQLDEYCIVWSMELGFLDERQDTHVCGRLMQLHVSQYSISTKGPASMITLDTPAP